MKPKSLVISAAAFAALVVSGMMLATSKAQPGHEALGENLAEPTEATNAALAATSESRSERAGNGVTSAYRYHAAPGSLLSFALEGDTRLEMRADDGTLTAGPALHLQGRITFGVRTHERGELVVEIKGRDLQVASRGTASGAEAERAARMLGARIGDGALVRMSERGEILGYRFPAETDPESRNWLRNLVDAARVLLPDATESEWTASESDAIGKAEVAMAWSADSQHDQRPFTKTKRRYLDGGEHKLRPQIDHSAHGTFDARLGWTSELHSREVATLRIAEAGVTVESRASFHFTLAETGSVAEAISTYSTTESAAHGAEDAREAHLAKQRTQWQTELEKVSAHELITALLDLAKGDLANPELMAARERLVWALRLFPERIAEVAQVVRAQQLEDKGLMVLLSALGAARTDATQSALADLTTPDLQDRTRVFALRSLFQVVEPNSKAMAAALAAVRDGNSSITADTALLLVGAFAARDGRNADALLALHPQAVAGEKLTTWLEAVGNAGTSKAFDLVEPHLAANDPHLREAALSALREMPGDAAVAALEQRFQEENVHELRGKAATLLASRPEPAGLRFLDRVLETEIADDLRIAALRGVVNKAGDPDVRVRIERVANTDASEKVRDYASRMLRDRG